MSAILFALIVCDRLPSYGNQPLMTWPFSNLSVYDPQCFANVLKEILYNCQWWRSVSLKQLLLVYSRPILSHSTLRKLGKTCSNVRNCALIKLKIRTRFIVRTINLTPNQLFPILIEKYQNCYRVLDLFWHDNIFANPRIKFLAKMTLFLRRSMLFWEKISNS